MTHMSVTPLATYLQEQLDRKGWSGRTLALYANVSQATIARAVKGETTPDPDSVRKIAAALEIEEIYLLRLAGHVESPAPDALDPEAAYIARRISELPPGVRQRAIDAVGCMLDTITDLVASGMHASGRGEEAGK